MPRNQVRKLSREPKSTSTGAASKVSNGKKSIATQKFSPLTEFPFFRDLSLEIRIMIWVLLLPKGRLIEVIYNPKTGGYYTDATQPILLYICQESRNEAKRFYEALEVRTDSPYSAHLAASLPSPRMPPRTPFGTYIDWKRDNIVIDKFHMKERVAQAHFLDNLSQMPCIQAKLRSLAISESILAEAPTNFPFTGHNLGIMNLQTIQVILRDPGPIEYAPVCCQGLSAQGHRRASKLGKAFWTYKLLGFQKPRLNFIKQAIERKWRLSLLFQAILNYETPDKFIMPELVPVSVVREKGKEKRYRH